MGESIALHHVLERNSIDVEQPPIVKEDPNPMWSEKKKNIMIVFPTMIVIIFGLIAVYMGINLFHFSRTNESNVAVEKPIHPLSFPRPTGTTPHQTRHPTPQPTISPTTPFPTLSPTTMFPTASPTGFERGIHEFLFQDGTDARKSEAATKARKSEAATKAIDWLVEEAVEAQTVISPFNQKFLQRYGILILYFSVFGDRNIEAVTPDMIPLPHLGMRNQNECTWFGMTCDENGMLTSITLTNRQLDGSLPSEWSFFPNLKSIDFYNNTLQGTIPEELYDILGLKQVFLYRNELTGSISSKIGQLWNLTHFHASHNRLSGSIPPEMASGRRIRQIRHFNVHGNQMSGVIPNNMRLRQMYWMDLGHNRFSGTLPRDLGTGYVRLRHLFLDHNSFLGTVPESYVVAGQERISTLYLNSNKLSGVFPGNDTLFRRMRKCVAGE
ncbi:MAG: hypothetical protein SGBAC_003995 [Bacillariaceae sp.]